MKCHSSFAAAMVPLLAVIAGCTSTEPPKLQSATPGPPLTQQDIGGRPTLAYFAPNVDFRQYKRFIIDPVDIYRGSDANWGDATPQDKTDLAQYMRTAFVNALLPRYAVVSTPGPDVIRLHLTLAGLEGTVPVASTVSRLMPAGLVMSLINSETGQPGSFSATVTVAGEFRDSQTGKLLASFIQKRYPDAMDIAATLTTKDSWQAAIQDMAETFRARVDKIQAGGKPTE